MSRATINWLGAIILAMICLSGNAKEQTTPPTMKFVGKWDSHAGIISFFVSEVGGQKQARMLVVDEHIENQQSKLSIDLTTEELDDFEDLVLVTLKLVGDPDKLPIPPTDAKEVQKSVGTLIYPNAQLTLLIVDPPGTERYIRLLFKAPNRIVHDYWMEKEDLMSLKKLLDKTLKELGSS